MNTSLYLSKDKVVTVALQIFVVVVVGLAIIGGFRSYSPVPYWDMWEGLHFFIRVSEGDWSAWWVNHNEHRIFLSRLLFWVDFSWFDGRGWFLIAVNYFLVGLSAFVFWRIIQNVNPRENSAFGKSILGLFVVAWLFLWSQNENLIWTFQSQFFLAYLLPLCALYWLHKSVADDHDCHFIVACCLGIASVGTMGNGILALPLMVFYALLTRQKAMRVGILAALSCITIYLYFCNYQAPSHHGSLTQAVKENPLGLIQYVLLYIGSPFYYLVGKGAFGKHVGLLAALFLVFSSAWLAIKPLRNPRENTLQLALLFFILYIGGTALGTGGGRLIFGVNQALSSRYTTPALMAWVALLVLYIPVLLGATGVKRKRVLFPFTGLAILMIVCQLRGLKAPDEKLFNHRVAALALELRIKDQEQIGHIYPDAIAALTIAEKISTQKLSIFGIYPFRDAREQLGSIVQQPTLPACQGSIDTMELVGGDARFVRVAGWMFNPAGKVYPQVIRFMNDKGKLVGYALTGQPRQDVADAVDKAALKSGYRGYVLADQKGEFRLQGESQAGLYCQVQVKAPMPLLARARQSLSADSATVDK